MQATLTSHCAPRCSPSPSVLSERASQPASAAEDLSVDSGLLLRGQIGVHRAQRRHLPPAGHQAGQADPDQINRFIVAIAGWLASIVLGQPTRRSSGIA